MKKDFEQKLLALPLNVISEETITWLNDNVNTSGIGIVHYPKGDYGHFICVSDGFEPSERMILPKDLHLLIQFAEADNYDWIMLDRDIDPNILDVFRTN